MLPVRETSARRCQDNPAFLFFEMQKRMVEEASQPGREREAGRLHLRGLRYKVHFLQQRLVVLLQGLLLCVKTQIMRLIPGGVMPLFSLPKGHLASDKETA